MPEWPTGGHVLVLVHYYSTWIEVDQSVKWRVIPSRTIRLVFACQHELNQFNTIFERYVAICLDTKTNQANVYGVGLK